MNDIDEAERLLLDVLYQACADDDGVIDNCCTSAYEEACNYLTERGVLHTKDGRFYLACFRIIPGNTSVVDENGENK